MLDPAVCERARRARDPRFDGRFFVAVATTGIYCRPICPAPTARTENVRYFPSAAAAESAGYRPCLRCRPEAAPGTPAWNGTAASVARALRLIDDGALDDAGLDALAARLGVGARHLRRLFERHVGASPSAVAVTRRVQLAKRLLDDTDLSIAAIAGAAGFGSVRRFNDVFRRVYGRTPREVRGRRTARSRGLAIRIPVRPPFGWPGLLAFLRLRAIPGIERVGADEWSRTFVEGEVAGTVRVRLADDRRALVAHIDAGEPGVVARVSRRVRRLFDADADPDAIHQTLSRDVELGALLGSAPGVRVPGAWDGFEVAVRAVLGQQVSVRAATTLCGRLVERHGRPIEGLENGTRFPRPAELADADLAGLGLPGARAAAIGALARAVAEGRLELDGGAPFDATLCALEALPGIGRWTARYVAMRALGEPDAFPEGDLGLQRALGLDARALRARAEAWRPWRAYAAMLLWRASSDGAAERRRDRVPHVV